MPHTHCCRCRVAFVEGEKTLLVSNIHGSYCEACQGLLHIGIASEKNEDGYKRHFGRPSKDDGQHFKNHYGEFYMNIAKR